MTLLDAFALDQIITLCMDVVVVVNSRTRVRRASGPSWLFCSLRSQNSRPRVPKKSESDDIMASPYSSIDAKALSPTNNTTTITFLFYLLFFHRLIGERRRQWRWKTWRLFIFTSYFGLLLISFLNSPFPNQNFRVVVIPNAHFFISFAIAFWDGVDTCEIFAASLWTIPYLR